MKFSRLILALSGLFCVVESSKILMVMYMGSKSHKNVLESLARGLAERGHQVTFLNPIPAKSRETDNLVEVHPSGLIKENLKMLSGWQNRDPPIKFGMLVRMFELSVQMCQFFLECPETKELLNSKYDLVLMDGVLQDCAIGLAYRLKVPFGYVAPGLLFAFQAMGTKNPFPSSTVPFGILPYTNEMTFGQRVLNFVYSNYADLVRYYYAIPRLDDIMQHHLGEDLPSLTDMERNISLVLVNQHFTIASPQAWLPEVVEVGGMHCRPAQQLPASLLDYVDGSEGFIYMSFGTVVRGSNIDTKLRDAFLTVFGKLKERVLWKWETETMEGVVVPKNVKLSKWVPQQDILGHPKCRLFITQGGLMSQQEGIYHGVPMLVIPFIGDQDPNAVRAQSKGFALKMEVDDITPEALHHNLRRLLDEPQFRQRIQEISRTYRDQPETPLERAIFWTEYVIRHKGAPHMWSRARNMPWYQIYLVDVILFITLVSAILFGTLFLMMRTLIRIVCGGRNKQKQD